MLVSSVRARRAGGAAAALLACGLLLAIPARADAPETIDPRRGFTEGFTPEDLEAALEAGDLDAARRLLRLRGELPRHVGDRLLERALHAGCLRRHAGAQPARRACQERRRGRRPRRPARRAAVPPRRRRGPAPLPRHRPLLARSRAPRRRREARAAGSRRPARPRPSRSDGALVASLWPVDDLATAILMESFHRHLRAGIGKAEALRRAKQEPHPSPRRRGSASTTAGRRPAGREGAGSPCRPPALSHGREGAQDARLRGGQAGPAATRRRLSHSRR
jgi:hypothetical protein